MLRRGRHLLGRLSLSHYHQRSMASWHIKSTNSENKCLSAPLTDGYRLVSPYQESRTRLFASVVPSTAAASEELLPPQEELEPQHEEEKQHVNGFSLEKQDAASASTTSLLSDEEAILKAKGITSRPVPNGNWDVKRPLEWAKDFGRRSQENEKRLQELIHLKPGDEGYFDVSDMKVPKVSIVRTVEDAKKVLAKLQAADTSIFHACDTEVMDIDLSRVGPVGNGYVTCVSIYSGEGFDYGLGDGPGTCLWIDNLDDACGVLQVFKEWFEDERFLKVWHNYGFDRHVMWNEGIDVKGFGGDTMHMARLQDTSRATYGTGAGYSLEALTDELLNRRKQPMKELFGVKRLRKDGSEGSLVDVPAVQILQRDPRFRRHWIAYSCYDAQATYRIREKLEEKLKKMSWIKGRNLFDYYFMHMRPFGEVLTDMERRGIRVDARDYLAKVEEQAREERAEHSRIFREWAATRIGPDGIALNPASSLQLCTFLFGGAENAKTGVTTETERVFQVPREEMSEDALEAYRRRDEEEAAAKTSLDGTDYLDRMKVAQLKALCKERGLRVSGKKAELQQRLREHFTSSEDESKIDQDEFDSMSDDDLRAAIIARGINAAGTREQLLEIIRNDIEFTSSVMASAQRAATKRSYSAIAQALEEAAKKEGGALAEYLEEMQEKMTVPPKYIDVKVSSLGLTPEKYTAGGAPSVTADVIRKLAGDPFRDPPRYGSVRKAIV